MECPLPNRERRCNGSTSSASNGRRTFLNDTTLVGSELSNMACTYHVLVSRTAHPVPRHTSRPQTKLVKAHPSILRRFGTVWSWFREPIPRFGAASGGAVRDQIVQTENRSNQLPQASLRCFFRALSMHSINIGPPKGLLRKATAPPFN